MNRIEKRFSDLKQRNETAFIPFITAGDPSLQATESIITQLDKKGADVIELGFPFSDPIADGPVIQASYNRALGNGFKINNIFDSIKNIRKESEIPIVAMVSYSIVYRVGYDKFIEQAKQAGIDGATIPDMPVEEATEVFDVGAKNDFKIVCFAAPTTTPKRIDIITAKTQGFLYYIAVVGITGARATLPDDISENIKRLKAKTDCPIAAGFGVSTYEQAATVGKIADGVIVGSAIVKQIEKHKAMPAGDIATQIAQFTENLIQGAKGK